MAKNIDNKDRDDLSDEEILREALEKLNNPDENTDDKGKDKESGNDDDRRRDEPVIKDKNDQQDGDEEEDSDEEREALRRQRREERRQRKEARRIAQENTRLYIKSLKDTNRELTKRIERLEGGRVSDHSSQVDNAINNAQRAVNGAKVAINAAIAAGDGDALSAAQEALTEAKIDLMKLQDYKGKLEEAAKTAHQKPQREAEEQEEAAEIDPEQAKAHSQAVQRNFQVFTQRNPWFKVGPNPDEVTRKAIEIDAQVAREGYDPANRDYWEEVEDRLREELPELYEEGEPRQRQRPASAAKKEAPANTNGKRRAAPVLTGGGSRSASGASKTIELEHSAARIEALKEAGLWDDPKKRTEMLKKYAKYDEQQKRA